MFQKIVRSKSGCGTAKMSKLKSNKDFASAATNYLRQSRSGDKVLKTFSSSFGPSQLSSQLRLRAMLIPAANSWKSAYMLSSSEAAIQPFNTIHGQAQAQIRGSRTKSRPRAKQNESMKVNFFFWPRHITRSPRKLQAHKRGQLACSRFRTTLPHTCSKGTLAWKPPTLCHSCCPASGDHGFGNITLTAVPVRLQPKTVVVLSLEENGVGQYPSIHSFHFRRACRGTEPTILR